jgi:hypothetical protein
MRLTLIALASSSLLLSGCHTLQIQSRVDPHTIATYSPGAGLRHDRSAAGSDLEEGTCMLVATGRDDHRGAINLDCFRFPEDRKQAYTPADRPTLAYVKSLAGRQPRNRLSSILIKQSDDICAIEMSELRANEATVNTAFSSLTTGVSAAATVVTGTLAKSILSGIATASSGVQSHVNVLVYRNQISEAVAQAIDVERDRLRDAILAKYPEDADSWTIDDAIRNINAYHGACSFYKGLQFLLMKPGQEKARDEYLEKLEAIYAKSTDTDGDLRDGGKDGAPPIRRRLPIADDPAPGG